MSEYRRRRFLLDLLFVGGAIVAAAGLASTGEAPVEPSPNPVATRTPAPPVATCTPDPMPMPGEIAAPPPPPRTTEMGKRVSPAPPLTPAPAPRRQLGGARAPQDFNAAGGLQAPPAARRKP